MQYSPEQISVRLHKDTGDSISIETIYQFIYRDKADGKIVKGNGDYMERRDIESLALQHENLSIVEIQS